MYDREIKWRELADTVNQRGGNGEETVSALKNLYSAYSSDVLIWLGSLFDTRLGGFYYSVSAKNNDGYLPDIESTYQALVLLRNSGVISEYSDIPELMRCRIAGFICSLEDPDSGYFYHPQWSKSLVDSKISRKGRDLTWAKFLSSSLKFELPYPVATSRLENAKKYVKDTNSDCLSSNEAFISYLDGLDFYKNPEIEFHRVISFLDQIQAAGFDETLIEYLNKIQNKENGFWAENPTFTDACLLYGITCIYTNYGKPLPNADKAVEYIIANFYGSVSDIKITQFELLRNLWGALDALINNLRVFGGEVGIKKADEFTLELIKKAPHTINATAEKLLLFKKSTGAFSLVPDGSVTTSQGVPVAPTNTLDGDVNATVISFGIIQSIYRALGIADSKINVFEPADIEKFITSIDLI